MDQGIHAEQEGETNFFATFLAVSQRIQRCCFRAGGGKGHFFATFLAQNTAGENTAREFRKPCFGAGGGKGHFFATIFARNTARENSCKAMTATNWQCSIGW